MKAVLTFEYEAFVYCWTDHATNKLYVGKHKGTIDDGYICSSPSMLLEYNKRPNDFSREIIAKGSHEDITKFEALILRKFQAHKDDMFYNLALANGVCVDTPEIRKKMSIAAKKRKPNRAGATQTDEAKMRISLNSKMSKAVMTPFGYFRSQAEFSRFIGVSEQNIKEFFKRLDVELKRPSRSGKLYSKTDIGKTPREIGYKYV